MAKKVKLTKEQMAEMREKLHVPNVSTMVMWHTRPDGTKEQRCPYCFSRRLRILDYSCSDENEKRFGNYKFIKKCSSCEGLCKVIVDITPEGNHMRQKPVVKEEA